MSKFSLFFLGIFLFAVTTTNAYESTYENISWDSRGTDTFYCLDICDENWNIYPGFQAVECNEDFHAWSPQHYVNQILRIDDLPQGFSFKWRVWSHNGYGGEGFEGRVVVGEDPACQGMPYASTQEKIQWECRGNDTFYCIDIFDEYWNILHQAAACNEGLHSFAQKDLGLPTGLYNWKIWSNSGYGGEGFEGQFHNSDVTIPTKVHGMVVIDETNAEVVATNAFENSNSALNSGTNSLDSIGMIVEGEKTAPTGSRSFLLTKVVLEALDQTEIISLTDTGVYLGAVQRNSQTIYGSCGGSANLNGTGDDNSGAFSFDMKYNNYCTNSGVTVTGAMTMTGQFDLAAEEIDSMSISFNNFRVSLQDTGVTASMSGSMDMTFTGQDSASIIIKMTVVDTATNKTYIIDNMTISISGIFSSYGQFSMSGRFYDPDYGYSDLTTIKPFKFYSSDNMPYSGVLLVTGANNSKSRFTILDRYSYMVEADTNGDGSYEFSTGTHSW